MYCPALWRRPRIYSPMYPYIRYQSHLSWDPNTKKFTNLIKDPKIQRTWILAKTSLELLPPKICWGNQNIPETCRTYLVPQQNFTEPCKQHITRKWSSCLLHDNLMLNASEPSSFLNRFNLIIFIFTTQVLVYLHLVLKLNTSFKQLRTLSYDSRSRYLRTR